MGRHESHRSTVSALLDASWSLSSIFWPNDSFDPPAPEPDRSEPARYLALGIEVESAERATFGGTVETQGRVVGWAWVEKDAGDGPAREMVDAIVGIFEDVESSGISFHTVIAGEPEVAGDWYGIPFLVPFTEYREP